MNAEAESIYNAAIALPAAEREELADRILRSLDGHQDLAVSAEQEAEIERRVKSIRDGTAKSVPAEEAFESILNQIRERKQA